MGGTIHGVLVPCELFRDVRSSGGCEMDHSRAPVARVRGPRYETSLLEPIDRSGNRTARELDASADNVATFEASAAGWAQANDSAAYQASLPEASANIDASFALGGRVEALTWANASHGQLAGDLYLRHPDVVDAPWAPIAPRLDAAVLWPTRFEVTAMG